MFFFIDTLLDKPFMGHLTHWGRVMHICISKVTIIGWDNGLALTKWQSHYLNQCWNIAHWNIRNKLQWKLKLNSYMFIQENAFQNAVCEMEGILFQPQCKSLAPERCCSHFKSVNFNLIIQNSSLGIQCQIALEWIPHTPLKRSKLVILGLLRCMGSMKAISHPTEEKSTLFQVMVWYHQVTHEPMLTHIYATIWCHYTTMD